MIENKNQCPFCNNIFESPRKRACHQRLCNLNPDKDILLEKLKNGAKKSVELRRNNPKTKPIKLQYKCNCKKCNTEYEVRCTEYDYLHGRYKKYCSLRCANSHIITDEMKDKIRKKLTTRIEHFCVICNIKLGKNNKSGYCRKCVHKTLEYKEKLSKSLKANPKVGGYRKGSGTGKSGWYKGYYCDSSWELAFVIYNLEHNIKFERNKKMFPYTYNGEEHNYLPDWLVDGKYVEIKGHDSEQWQAKIEQFPKDLTLEVLYRDNMQKYLGYVRDKYGNNFIELYDDSKPVKNINDQVATWFHLKNEKTGKFIQLYVFKENYDIYLNNGWSLGRYSPLVHKNYTVIKHTDVRRVSEIEKEKILRNMIN